MKLRPYAKVRLVGNGKKKLDFALVCKTASNFIVLKLFKDKIAFLDFSLHNTTNK
jgi:hypothetical protein